VEDESREMRQLRLVTFLSQRSGLYELAVDEDVSEIGIDLFELSGC
jgi:hypothetical protein